MTMRGIGGPLLCIGDLLSDVGEPDDDLTVAGIGHHLSSVPSSPSDLNTLFQENYDHLTKALDGTDQSWTSLTLKLCSTLDTANKLINSTNSNTILLSEKVMELEGMIKRRDVAVAQVRSIHSSLIHKGAASTTTVLK